MSDQIEIDADDARSKTAVDCEYAAEFMSNMTDDDVFRDTILVAGIHNQK